MEMRRKMSTVVMVMAAIGLAAGATHAATLISEDFQSPMYPNNTDDPSFTGWTFTYNNPQHLNSRLSAATPGGTSDFPGANGNQGIQFEWTNVEGSYTVSAPSWNTGDVFELTVDVAPQQWNGANDRYFAPSLIQGGTTIWSANTLMDKWSGSPVWEQKQYYIPTTGFTSGTDITLHLDHTGQRGLYLDNVNLKVDVDPGDNDPPLPNPPTWDTAPTVFDYTSVFMSVNPASDPYGVEYLFTNTTTANNSGWQDSTQWVEGGLDQTTSYDYSVIARDKSPSQNATSAATDSATTDGLDGLIFSSGFEYPKYSNGTLKPDFFGWEWTGNVRSRTSANQSDVPCDDHPDTPNQVIQFEYTQHTGTRATSHLASADEVYTLTLNASPQSWHGQDARSLIAILLGSDVVWSDTVALPLYDNFGRNPWTQAQTFTFVILGSDLPAAAIGQPLSVKIQSSGERGIYFDNVMLTYASATVIPEPATMGALGLAVAGLGGYVRKRRRS